MFPRVIHGIVVSVLHYLYCQIIFHCTDIVHFGFLLISWWMFGFPLLAIVNNATMNVFIQAFVWICIFDSLGYVPWMKLLESCGSYMLSILRNCQMVAEFYIPIVWRFQLIHILINTCYCSIFCILAITTNMKWWKYFLIEENDGIGARCCGFLLLPPSQVWANVP